MHRIGRTGRAGASGQAVSLVCMDEEGFMMDIERFTRQTIPVQLIEGFGPEDGEKAEPIAMGRQTIWGGAGKPPSRDVMQAAAKAARGEMMERMRAGKTAGQGDRGGRAGGGGAPRAGNGNGAGRSTGPRGAAPAHPGGSAGHGPRSAGQGQGPARSRGPGQGPGNGPARFNSDAQPPRENAHLGTHGGHSMPSNRSSGAAGGQPDPMRTSVDSMLERGRRGGGFRSGPGGGGARPGGGAPRGPGGGGGSRGGYGR